MNDQKIEVELASVIKYINSKEFNDFLLNTTSYENALFISGILCQTLDYMINGELEKIEKSS